MLYPVEITDGQSFGGAQPPEMKKIQSRLYLRSKLLGLTVPLSLPRRLGACGRRIDCRWQTVKAREAEVNGIDASSEEVRHTGSLGSMPLVVVSRDPEKGAAPGLILAELSRRFDSRWVQMQEELARLSTNGSRVVATGSTHYVQIDRPDVVIAAIRKVLDAARITPLIGMYGPPPSCKRKTRMTVGRR